MGRKSVLRLSNEVESARYSRSESFDERQKLISKNLIDIRKQGVASVSFWWNSAVPNICKEFYLNPRTFEIQSYTGVNQ